MRRLFTTSGSGLTLDALRWGVRSGAWRRVQRGVYAEGPGDPTPLDRARARVLAADAEARGALAGVLHRLDGVRLDDRPVRRSRLQREQIAIVAGLACADARTTLVDLAVLLDDDRWEQALESALRKRLVTVDDFDDLRTGTHGLPRIRRVLARRPPGAPPTESLLETLALQLARPVLGEPTRQLVLRREDGSFIARIDLTWPPRGVFFELDGEHHKDQPVYDASRQTAVVAATGWLPGRFTWTDITRTPRSSQRRMVEIDEQARQARQARLRRSAA